MPKTVTYRGIDLHKGQQRVLGEILLAPKETRYVTIKCSRQWGKTIFGIQLALYHALNEAGANILWASPVIAQAKKVMEQVHSATAKSGVIFNFNKTDRIIKFLNGSTIYFAGTDSEDSLRGGSYDYCIADEAAFFKQGVFDTVIRPTLSVIGKRAYLISTPKGKRNYFYNYYINGKSGDPTYMTLEGLYLDNPYYNLEEVENAKKNLPDFIFKQEYLGEFLDAEFSVFQGFQDCCVMKFQEPQPGESYAAGCDLGKAKDFTVVTIVNSKGEVVYIYRINNLMWNPLVKNITDLLKKYNNASILIETNNVGDVIAEQLEQRYHRVYEFLTTSTTKNPLIEDLIVAIQQKDLKLPLKEVFTQLYDELSYFEFSYNPRTRHIRYAAPQGEGFHDDCVISLALANKALKQYIYRDDKPIIMISR